MTVAVSSCLAEAASEGASLLVAMLARDSHLAVGSQCSTSWPVSGCVCTLPITWEALPATNQPQDIPHCNSCRQHHLHVGHTPLQTALCSDRESEMTLDKKSSRKTVSVVDAQIASASL